MEHRRCRRENSGEVEGRMKEFMEGEEEGSAPGGLDAEGGTLQKDVKDKARTEAVTGPALRVICLGPSDRERREGEVFDLLRHRRRRVGLVGSCVCKMIRV